MSLVDPSPLTETGQEDRNPQEQSETRVQQGQSLLRRRGRRVSVGEGRKGQTQTFLPDRGRTNRAGKERRGGTPSQTDEETGSGVENIQRQDFQVDKEKGSSGR